MEQVSDESLPSSRRDKRLKGERRTLFKVESRTIPKSSSFVNAAIKCALIDSSHMISLSYFCEKGFYKVGVTVDQNAISIPLTKVYNAIKIML